jgi:hypothetical protein
MPKPAGSRRATQSHAQHPKSRKPARAKSGVRSSANAKNAARKNCLQPIPRASGIYKILARKTGSSTSAAPSAFGIGGTHIDTNCAAEGTITDTCRPRGSNTGKPLLSSKYCSLSSAQRFWRQNNLGSTAATALIAMLASTFRRGRIPRAHRLLKHGRDFSVLEVNR